MLKVNRQNIHDCKNNAFDLLEACAKSEFPSMVKYILKTLKEFSSDEVLDKANTELRSAEASFIAGDYFNTLRCIIDAARKLDYEEKELYFFERMMEGMLIYNIFESFV